MHWQPARRLMIAFCALFLVMLAACNGGGGTPSTAQGGATATVAPTASTTDATSTPGTGTPTTTPMATPPPGSAPTATPGPPQTVIYSFTGTAILTAFNVATRGQIWHRDLGGPRSRPVYANGLLYVYGEPAQLEAYDPHTGAHVWEAPYYYDGNAPIVTSSMIYNFAFQSNNGTTNTYTLTGLNAHTGAFVWHQTVDSEEALLVDSTLYIPGPQSSTTMKIYSFDAATGTPQTTYAISAPSGNLLAISNGITYFTCSATDICAASLASQSVIWKDHTNDAGHSRLTVVNGIAYFSADDRLYAVNATTGALAWAYLTGHQVQSNPIVYNGNIYFISYDNYYYALDSSGHLLWKDNVGGGGESGQVYNGTIFFPQNTTATSVILEINPTTGKTVQLGGIRAVPFVVAPW